MRTLYCVVLFVGLTSAADIKPGVERWPVKASVPNPTNFAKPTTAALTDLLALPEVTGVT